MNKHLANQLNQMRLMGLDKTQRYYDLIREAELEPIKPKLEIYKVLKELNGNLSFEEKAVIWQEALEDILVSMEDQRNNDGLMMQMEVSLADIQKIFTENVESIRARLDRKKYILVPGDSSNDE